MALRTAIHGFIVGSSDAALGGCIRCASPVCCSHSIDNIITRATAEPTTIEPEHRELPPTLSEPNPSVTETPAAENSVVESVATLAPSDSSPDASSVQRQVEALWDAVKWMEDRMEAIDVDRRRELQEASRDAAHNTARVQQYIPHVLSLLC